MKPTNKEIFEQIKVLPFTIELAKRYEAYYPFTEESIRIETYDEFGQCSVWLGFEDQFAIRDAFGNWRMATAEECIDLRGGNLPGSMTLVN
ncbi:TPA: hypothetical protein ACGTF0_004276 [Salmonella enterica]|uniref:Uncharacterized protein n=1 Tax=Salmonella hadar TaxID=149385 RepID=A0A5Y2PB76_SALHA|nr:hypothetical protein [Salmonella enterica subsp. enterica serovar Hadar]EAU0201517.1 hypothetical protein [Salmonella enterica]EBY7132654.1 hypothetical protein [Salmonella enterica subsp. enterica serovar Albany]ECE0138101.1 hypothetical protein [Salmonella enterica subsp. enterica serovar Hvittingfoss]EDT6679858.1 hypothetical protein [Salmonella enterica subsp. enterica]EDT7238533.1 hypothetical protein [Salmonella enterica subsp. enterica serovar Warragul]EDW4386181.1 hypothetical prot